ncbi:unnamed protein product [Sympodiomycopsis kandeliae]
MSRSLHSTTKRALLASAKSPDLRVALSRSIATTARLEQQPGSDRPQALHNTADEHGKPANPSPPPRAAASTPQPGSSSHKSPDHPTKDSLTRRPPAPPYKGAPSSILQKVASGVASFFGLSPHRAAALGTTRDLYEECAAIWDIDRDFWQGECGLPPTYQSWFQVTNLHVMLLMIRYRDLPPNISGYYQQELINNFFIDAELRMRSRFSIRTSRLVKGYMKEIHSQQRGSQLAVDEALSMLGNDGQGDSRLAQALWRNMFGAGWGDVGGVLSRVRGVDPEAKKDKDGAAPPDTGAVLAQDKGPSFNEGDHPSQQRLNAYLQGKVVSDLPAGDEMAQKHPELAFPIVLSRLTKYFLRELRRLAAISDHEVEQGRLSRSPGPSHGRAPPQHIDPKNLASVGAGETIERTVVRPLGLDVQSEQSRGDGDGASQGAEYSRNPLSIATFGRP